MCLFIVSKKGPLPSTFSEFSCILDASRKYVQKKQNVYTRFSVKDFIQCNQFIEKSHVLSDKYKICVPSTGLQMAPLQAAGSASLSLVFSQHNNSLVLVCDLVSSQPQSKSFLPSLGTTWKISLSLSFSTPPFQLSLPLSLPPRVGVCPRACVLENYKGKTDRIFLPLSPLGTSPSWWTMGWELRGRDETK